MPYANKLAGISSIPGYESPESKVTALPHGGDDGGTSAREHVEGVISTQQGWSDLAEAASEGNLKLPMPAPKPTSLQDLVIAARRRVTSERVTSDAAESERQSKAAKKLQKFLGE